MFELVNVFLLGILLGKKTYKLYDLNSKKKKKIYKSGCFS